MFFFFTCGTGDYSGELHGYEHMVFKCRNCNNDSVRPIKRRVFFTFCFIPIVPLKWNPELRCHICNYHQKVSKQELDQMLQAPPQSAYASPSPGYVNSPMSPQPQAKY